MDAHEYRTYLDTKPAPREPVIGIVDVPGPDRTLVYGYSRTYDTDGNESTHTVHVYKQDNMLHAVFYRHDGERVMAVSERFLPVSLCAPKKRAYPERCDLSFARVMRARGETLSFTNFDETRKRGDGPFYGLLIDETTEPVTAI